jgi:rod shape-determining protein MreD
MRSLLVLAIGLALVTAQSLLHRVGVPEWLLPQGLVACVVYLAFFESSVTGALLAFSCGLLLDLTTATVLGPWAGAYVLVYALLSFMSPRLFVESALVTMVVTAVTSVLSGAIYLFLAFEYQALSREDVVMLLGQALASALVAPTVVSLLGRVRGRSISRTLGRTSVVSAV